MKVRPLTAIERTAISELCEMAQVCISSKSSAVKAIGVLMAERAATIVRGSTKVYTWPLSDIRQFAKVFRAHEPAAFAPDYKPRKAKR